VLIDNHTRIAAAVREIFRELHEPARQQQESRGDVLGGRREKDDTAGRQDLVTLVGRA